MTTSLRILPLPTPSHPSDTPSQSTSAPARQPPRSVLEHTMACSSRKRLSPAPARLAQSGSSLRHTRNHSGFSLDQEWLEGIDNRLCHLRRYGNPTRPRLVPQATTLGAITRLGQVDVTGGPDPRTLQSHFPPRTRMTTLTWQHMHLRHRGLPSLASPRTGAPLSERLSSPISLPKPCSLHLLLYLITSPNPLSPHLFAPPTLCSPSKFTKDL